MKLSDGHKNAPEPLPKVALIGAGSWGKNLARNLNDLGVLAALCDPNAAVLESARTRYPQAALFADYRDVLASDAIQGVVIATPAGMHAAMSREAILAGKDVLVEKPLALSEEDGAQVVELAEKQGRVLMVGHLLWYHPAIIKLKALVDAGELGRLQYIYSQRLNLGKIRREENILWSFAPHDISIILGLAQEMPNQVQTQGGYYFNQSVADVTVSCFGFRSGICAHVFVSWLHPYKEQRLVVVGDRKMAVFNDLAASDKLLLYPHTIEWKANMPIPSHKEAEPVPIESSEPLKGECQHFIDCIRMRATPRTDGKEALRVLRVLGQCQRALEREHKDALNKPPLGDELSADGDRTYFAHPTACVDEGAEIGQGTSVWHFSHVMSGSRVGKNCRIGQNVFVGPQVLIGDGVKIQNNVSVYEGVILDDYVFCGPSVVFTNVSNPRSEIERKHEFKATRVLRGATLGANATIVCGITIGRYAFVAAGAVATRDIPDYALVLGNPARITGWMCSCGERLHNATPEREPGRYQCTACAKAYHLNGDRLTPAADRDAGSRKKPHSVAAR